MDSNLSIAIARTEALLAEADAKAGTYADDPSGYHARLRFELDRIGNLLANEFGARINDRWDGAAIRMAGIRSSSTMGLGDALRNWLTAARKRLETA